ncbi:MAG TPA: glycerophosphodiester phosphodiesterase family protein [Polyangiaceae bacterium]|jgi:glycerophosphoryl diester phosphodiesterase|nr:glycerophosphodiester phosphodiesterase family protein [Polyangiaceae bacterium]
MRVSPALSTLVLVATSACTGPSGPPIGPRSALLIRAIDAPKTPDFLARPRTLIAHLDDGPLKTALARCDGHPLVATRFSIGHRGAARGFPEHTRESYQAAATMGAGLIECDVTFTKDKKLVCRHSQCDLATTTNILAVPALAAKCAAPFSPADLVTGKEASARCCTSDLTLAEFSSLCGKMDGHDPRATTPAAYLKSAADADSAVTCGKVMSHAESIAVIDRRGRDFVPELKAPEVPMPFDGYTLDDFAEALADDYRAAGVAPRRIFVQSANLRDLTYWSEHAPELAANAIYLDESVDTKDGYAAAVAALPGLAARGIHTVAPPMWALVDLDATGRIVPSLYAKTAKASGLDLVTWTLERSGSLEHGGGYYYQSVRAAIHGEGDIFRVLDVLATDVGIRGIFSDWPATSTYYANCMGL